MGLGAFGRIGKASELTWGLEELRQASVCLVIPGWFLPLGLQTLLVPGGPAALSQAHSALRGAEVRELGSGPAACALRGCTCGVGAGGELGWPTALPLPGWASEGWPIISKIGLGLVWPCIGPGMAEA